MLALVALVLIVTAVIWLIVGGTDHIEDTNGAEDFSLQTITDQQIIDGSMGAKGGPTISRGHLLNDAIEFSSKKFTGVYEVLYDSFVAPSDFEVNLSSYTVNGGNFKMVVVHNDEIIAVLEPNQFVDYRIEDITGDVSLRIVGESASFNFSISEFEYDLHSHET